MQTSQVFRSHRVIIARSSTRIRASVSGTRGASNRERTAVASRHHRDARADDRHASVERLSVPVIIAIASACLVNRGTLADIKPSFENDTNIVPMPPE
jgi:hypothetical protein